MYFDKHILSDAEGLSLSGRLLVSKRKNPLTLSLSKGVSAFFDSLQRGRLLNGEPEFFNELMARDTR